MTDMKDLVLGVTIFGGDVEPTVFRDSKYDVSGQVSRFCVCLGL